MNSREDCQLIASAGAVRDYSRPEADAMGRVLAETLKLKRDPEHKDRWQTTWGSKTNAGLARTVLAEFEKHGEFLLKGSK